MRPEFLETSYITLMNAIKKYRLARIENANGREMYSKHFDALLALTSASDIRSIRHALHDAKRYYEYLLDDTPAQRRFYNNNRFAIMAYEDTVDALGSMRRFEGLDLNVPTSSHLESHPEAKAK
jgi:hypothetical protein